jgi:hypothetical protein
MAGPLTALVDLSLRHAPQFNAESLQSAVMAAAARIHRATWLMLDHFLPVSEFVGNHAINDREGSIVIWA